jgi:hypothetical protein
MNGRLPRFGRGASAFSGFGWLHFGWQPLGFSKHGQPNFGQLTLCCPDLGDRTSGGSLSAFPSL